MAIPLSMQFVLTASTMTRVNNSNTKSQHPTTYVVTAQNNMHLVEQIVQPMNLYAAYVDTLGTGNQNAGEVLLLRSKVERDITLKRGKRSHKGRRDILTSLMLMSMMPSMMKLIYISSMSSLT